MSPEHRAKLRAMLIKRHADYRAAMSPLGLAMLHYRQARASGAARLLDACEYCGSTKRLHGHHASRAPDMAFFVTTLCAKCHARLHCHARAWLRRKVRDNAEATS